MIIHCKPYKYNIHRVIAAVFITLLGLLYAYGETESNPSSRPRIALLGDSMTWIGGDSCQNETGWSYILKESGIAEDIEVYARSGATWTNTKNTKRNPAYYSELLHDDNVVYNQAIRLIEHADSCNNNPNIIILFAGANDAWFATKRPGIYEDDQSKMDFTTQTHPGNITSLGGSIRLVHYILNNRFPMATLLFVTPLQMSKTDAETIFKVSDIIEKVATENGCLVLRADKESGITHQQETQSPTFTYDGVHTNPAGAKKLGEYILSYLLTLPNTSTNNTLLHN